jgi:hypothetical protein
MEAVVRVYGKKLDVSELLAKASPQPYRVDRVGSGRSKTNCLHYEVSRVRGSGFDELLRGAKDFIEKNEDFFLQIKNRPDVDGVVLDIGMGISGNVLSSVYRVDVGCMNILVRLGISFEISVYKEQ